VPAVIVVVVAVVVVTDVVGGDSSAVIVLLIVDAVRSVAVVVVNSPEIKSLKWLRSNWESPGEGSLLSFLLGLVRP
jgi:hypothetical protein